MKTTIEKEAPVVTLINVFTVDPSRQDELVKLLDDATEQVMRKQPGFVSANIHRGLDGRHVANYAQWTSREAMEAMLANPEAQHHIRIAASMAEFAPSLYRVASVHRREDE
jgi:quinol monooxygenase YgiN